MRRRGRLRLLGGYSLKGRMGGWVGGVGVEVSRAWWREASRTASRPRRGGSMGGVFGALISCRGRGAFVVCFCPF